MKRFYKIIGRLAGIFAVAGIILCIIGAVFGAKGMLAIAYSKDDGFKLLDASDVWKYEDLNMEAFDSIHIDANTSEIKIVKSSSDQYGVKCNINGNKEDINIRVVNGTLYIEDENDSTVFTFNFLNSDDSEIIVFVPDSTVLKNIYLNSAVGDVEIQDIAGANILEVTTDVGDVKVKGGNYERVSLNTNVGDVTTEKITITEAINVLSDVGDIELNGEFLCNIDLETRVGDTDIETSVGEKEYNYNISTNLGDVDVFGKSEGVKAQREEDSAKYIITINSDVGDIEVN